MKVYIKDTQTYDELTILDVKTQLDYSNDFIGNAGGFNNKDFIYNKQLDVYETTQDNFDWWQNIMQRYEQVESRIADLSNEYGQNKVLEVIEYIQTDFEGFPDAVNYWLDEAFPNNINKNHYRP